MTTFVQLIQMAMGVREPELEEIIPKTRWKEMFATAKKQAVLGILSQIVEKVPHEQLVLGVESYLFMAAEKIRAKNGKMSRAAVELTRELEALGLKSCILKGQGYARYYPDPSLRQCGDIDVWVEGGIRDVIRAIGSKWKISKLYYHHADIFPFGPACPVEVHFCPSWMNNPFMNRKLRRYFRETAQDQFSSYSPELGFVRPSREFDCSFCAIHIYRHLLLEGVGMRQLMDYYYILNGSSESDRQLALRLMTSLKMTRFLSALMYAMQYFFGISSEYLLCEPDRCFGEFFVREVRLSGNFGAGDTRYSYNADDNILRRIVSRMTRLRNFRRIAPGEVFWAPYFKTMQFFWLRIYRAFSARNS